LVSTVQKLENTLNHRTQRAVGDKLNTCSTRNMKITEIAQHSRNAYNHTSRDLLVRLGAGLDLGSRSLFRSTPRDFDKILHSIIATRQLKVQSVSLERSTLIVILTHPLSKVAQEARKQRQERNKVGIERQVYRPRVLLI
jgi:hypothetical protein